MAEVVLFDGPNKTIIEIDAAGDNILDVVEIYSEWKEWVKGQRFFDTSSDVNGTTERITITAHSMHTGQPVRYSDEGGVVNVGLTDGVEYFARSIDDDTIELYDTRANANAGPATTGRQDLTAGASESHKLTADNAKFLQAFTPVGGDPIDGSTSLGITYFLENGWRIRPAESDHKLTVVGNLFTVEAGQSAFIDTLGAFTVNTETRVSSLVTAGFWSSSDINLVRQALVGNVTVSLDDQTVTIFDTDGVTPIATLAVSIDTRVRTRTS